MNHSADALYELNGVLNTGSDKSEILLAQEYSERVFVRSMREVGRQRVKEEK